VSDGNGSSLLEGLIELGLMDPERIADRLRQHGLEAWADQVPRQLRRVLVEKPHGDLERWFGAVRELPMVEDCQLICDRDAVGVRCPQPIDVLTRERVRDCLQRLRPWRKGPFDILGVEIDTEWRSNLKWDRLRPHLGDLHGRLVLDVGCGNGYYAWRLLCQGAGLVVGIDPTQLFLAQYLVIRRLLDRPIDFDLLPLGVEQLPAELRRFDTVLSMGVLYHRRSPIDHLLELRGALRSGGELVLETLVIDAGPGEVLVPDGRYAKMRNVWFIPSAIELERWLRRFGFRKIRTVDLNRTSIEEQRPTDWMTFESLPDFLDPEDRSRTVEGYPAPLRAIVIAEAP
jgi:tRNA (mo5U34)-methyltransferase